MLLNLQRIVPLLAFAVGIAAAPLTRRLAAANDSLLVDLGYAIYQGLPDGHGSNAWTGIRYAAPTGGQNRWRPPQAPPVDRSQVIFNYTAPQCPQAFSAPAPSPYDYSGDEDCLFLNVFAPVGADRPLPVLVYIHGGGYGAGNAQENFTQLLQVNNFGFLAVAIQYRLGAFGFLASSAVHADGSPNAGLLDQHFALEWIQAHIAQFGGDPRRVTIVGESAGGGSVEMQALAYGGSEGTKYFEQGIASSPYTPIVYRYSDAFPESGYLKLAAAVGCFAGNISGSPNLDPAILACLRQVESSTLQSANYHVSASGTFGTWLYVPVIDGTFLQQQPGAQLARRQVNGARMLTSNNADEGASFVDPTIRSAADFDAWLFSEYPALTAHDLSLINNVFYPLQDQSAVPFSTCGNCDGPTAVDTGAFAIGHLQRAINFYSEATFDCPSYWLASAFQGPARAAYKYQVSVPAGYHGIDLSAEALNPYPNVLSWNIGKDFFLALTTSWGNFVASGDPSISNLLANGNSIGGADSASSANAASTWPAWQPQAGGHGRPWWPMMNWNETGGVPFNFTGIAPLVAVEYGDPGLRNDIALVDGFGWEGGRGVRCEFLRRLWQ